MATRVLQPDPTRPAGGCGLNLAGSGRVRVEPCRVGSGAGWTSSGRVGCGLNFEKYRVFIGSHLFIAYAPALYFLCVTYKEQWNLNLLVIIKDNTRIYIIPFFSIYNKYFFFIFYYLYCCCRSKMNSKENIRKGLESGEYTLLEKPQWNAT